MQSSLYGWNVEEADLGGRHNTIVNELTSYRANWQFCLGGEGLAVRLLSHVEKGVILRIFDPFGDYGGGSNPTFDNSFWLNHSPMQVVAYVNAHLSHLKTHDKLWFSIGNNEPGTQGKTKAFLKWCIELADLGYQYGIKFAIAEIATAKSVDHNEVKNGVWDEFIRTMDKYRGFHILTFHEYTTGLLPATFLPDYPLNLDNPDVLKQSNWQNAKMNLSDISGNYHLGRGCLVSHVRAKQLGIAPIPFVITECAFDFMADIISSPERLASFEALKNRFRQPPHDFMRGSTGHQKYHEWLMRETGFQGDWNDYLFEQYKWFINAYPAECEGITDFALNADWDIEEGHDKSQPRNDKFRQRVISEPIVRGQVTMPEPTPDQYIMERKLLSSRAVTNIRDNHNTTGTIIDTLRADDQDVIEVLASDKALWTGNNLNWYRLEYGGGVRYVADTNNLVWSDVPDDTPDTGEPGETPDTDTPSIAEILAAIEAQYPILKDLAALSELMKQFEPVKLDIPVGDITITTTRGSLPYIKSLHRGYAILHNEIYKQAARANGDVLAQDIFEDVFINHAQAANVTFSGLPVEAESEERTNIDVMLHSGDENDNAA